MWQAEWWGELGRYILKISLQNSFEWHTSRHILDAWKDTFVIEIDIAGVLKCGNKGIASVFKSFRIDEKILMLTEDYF